MAKRIVLITQASFSEASTGTSQTLENLFDGYPKADLVICSPEPATGTFGALKNVAYYSSLLQNRFVKKLVPEKIRDRIFAKWVIPGVVRKIAALKPDLVVVANVDYAPALIADALVKSTGTPLCIYLLDDLQESPDPALNALYQGLMKKAKNHVFISNYMAEANTAKFAGVQHWMVVHNPVAENDIASQVTIREQSGEITFAYAGSIWQMHSDALFAFAAGIDFLRKQGMNVRLVVYTTKSFHGMFASKFDELDITYGGFVPFASLKALLLQYNALLVASSFEPGMKMLSSYSVQTKITDYLACGLPVLSIGPAYSACNRFIEEHRIGSCILVNETEAVASRIQQFLSAEPAHIRGLAENGLQLVKEKYKKSEIQGAFYTFLEACR